MSKIEELHKQVELAFYHGYERYYVETGRYKGYMPNTVQALAKRGYKVERAPGNPAAFHVYPKQGV